jgi:hypothetical protein
MVSKGQFILFDDYIEFDNWLNQQNIKRTIKTIQIHHTWSPNYSHFKSNNHFQLVESMKKYHTTSAGMNDIAQQISTYPDGKIMVCRSFEKNPAGIKGQNTGAICIENIGNFDINGDTMTDKHKSCIIGITASMCKKFNLTPNTDTIVYHHWFDLTSGRRNNGTYNNKTCPGTNFFGGNKVNNAANNFIPLVAKEINKLKGIKMIEDWKLKLFEECMANGIITDESWKDKMDEPAQVWMTMAMINNLYKKIKA